MDQLLTTEMLSEMALQSFREKLTFISGINSQYNGVRADRPSVVVHSLPAPRYPTKCPSCGSHQFVMHANRRICSYCRTEG